MQEAIGYVALVAVVGVGLLVLWAIFRFSIVSSLRMRGSRATLRRPDVAAVEMVCEFPLPGDLARMYAQAPFIERKEFELVDHSLSPPVAWAIGEFNALTAPIVREWRTIANLKRGVPIASDLDKGVYFVTREGAVMRTCPGMDRKQVQVAPSVAVFSRFEFREIVNSDA